MRRAVSIFSATGVGAAVFLAVGMAFAESDSPALPSGSPEQLPAETLESNTPTDASLGEKAAGTLPSGATMGTSPTARRASPAQSGFGARRAANAPTEDEHLIEELLDEHPEWGCDYRAYARTESHLLLACQGGSILTLLQTPRGVQVTARRQVNGEVTEFFEHEGAVWTRITMEGAELAVPGRIVASGSTLARLVPPTDDGREDLVAPHGVVSQVEGRDVVVELADGFNLKPGERMTLWRSLGGDELLSGEAPVVGKVVRAHQGRALIRLGMNEVVEVGFEAHATEEPETASRRRPPRAFDLWDMRAVIRPVLSSGPMGGGVGGEFEVGRRTEHFRYGVHITPLSLFGARNEETLFSGSGYIFGALDQPLFAVGMGIGAATVNDTDGYSASGSGTSLVQSLRVGAVDGAYLESRMEAVVFRSEILFGYFQLTGQLPVADDMWVVARGGGGRLGYGFGEVVVRRLLWGNGGAGSAFWELGWGGMTMFDETCPRTDYPDVDSASCRDTSLSGPMMVGGMHWRL